MKRFTLFSILLGLALVVTPAIRAQSASNQVIPGTKVHITLLDDLTTKVAHNGDPFTAIVAEPVFSGNQLLLPAGAKIHGTVTGVERPKLFSMFRGGASMNIAFNSVEVESRIFPVRMSILDIYAGGTDSDARRKDIKTVEGEVVEENHDIKNDVIDVGIGTAGGSTAGLIFSHVLRGTVLGLVGSGAYIAAKKGKEVELPAQTRMVVRVDTDLSLPASLLHSASYTPNGAE